MTLPDKGLLRPIIAPVRLGSPKCTCGTIYESRSEFILPVPHKPEEPAVELRFMKWREASKRELLGLKCFLLIAFYEMRPFVSSSNMWLMNSDLSRSMKEGPGSGLRLALIARELDSTKLGCEKPPSGSIIVYSFISSTCKLPMLVGYPANPPPDIRIPIRF